MATPAQLAEKLRQDRLGAEGFTTAAQQDHLSSNSSEFATPGQLAEKASAFATPAQLAEKGQRHGPPPLPPRTSSALAPPPAYSHADARRSQLISEQWRSNDPRSSSTHSLAPSESQRNDCRRTLLLVFIHGFMGNELSFQSFPAHAHNLLTIALAETHIVHTKLYPRYKSRNSIQNARDDFSNWLEPHESYDTDIVLLGHSMGGILAAEVVLKQPLPSTSRPLQHRILGMIGFDTPFLGMHPGVVVSGIGSLFRPAPEPLAAPTGQESTGGLNTPIDSQAPASSPSYATSTTGSIESSQLSLVSSVTSPLGSPPINDPNFDAPFTNDVHIPERKGWNSLLHFINKHSDGLVDATKSYFMSHIEFGSCLADYPGMKVRYEKVRALEDAEDEPESPTPTQRVRFTNYYTASTGRPKRPKAPKETSKEMAGENLGDQAPDDSSESAGNRTPTLTPSISVVQHRRGASTPRQLDEVPTIAQIESEMQNPGEDSGVYEDALDEPFEMRHIESTPIQVEEEEGEPEVLHTMKSENSSGSLPQIHLTKTEPSLPPIPEMPIEPAPIDLDAYTDKDSRKIAEKEQKRAMKLYQQAVKDRASAIKDRKKLLEKRMKRTQQEEEKKLKAEEKQEEKEEKANSKKKLREYKVAERGKGKTTAHPYENVTRQSSETPPMKDHKPKRDKKFCMLPPTIRGQGDKCWVRIYMEGVDEVGAHCGLFFPGPHYERLVGDLGARIEQWVQEVAANRAVVEIGRA